MKIRWTWLAVGFVAMAAGSARAEKIDTSPLDVTVEQAFPQLRFVRPVVLTHPGDGTNRVVVASQLGEIRIFLNDQAVKKSSVFLDLRDRVVYKDKQNEEGLLGLAFHPMYRENGQFFVYYTTTDAPHTSVVSRFRVSPDDPNRADAKSEEEILRVKQPFWNHNGGTIAFGPDGYLYIALGDGGSGNDPLMNGQNLNTLLGAILRVDVDGTTPKDPEDDSSVPLAYAIPADNPFAGFPGMARPEIWAYGLRNVWRMSFDRQTGQLWAADVGQNLWEEINLIRRGGNYGWNLREAKHKFGPGGSGPREDLIDPIFEYHHKVGKSITGGHVYRGQRLPQLAGKYIYADYVTGKLWALAYDAKAGRVAGNHPIPGGKMPVLSFGEDEPGEVYFCTDDGKIHRFSAAD